MRRRILIALGCAVASALAVRLVRDYPWELALISGALVGGLAFATLQTLVRLREQLGQFGRKR